MRGVFSCVPRSIRRGKRGECRFVPWTIRRIKPNILELKTLLTFCFSDWVLHNVFIRKLNPQSYQQWNTHCPYPFRIIKYYVSTGIILSILCSYTAVYGHEFYIVRYINMLVRKKFMHNVIFWARAYPYHLMFLPKLFIPFAVVS